MLESSQVAGVLRKVRRHPAFSFLIVSVLVYAVLWYGFPLCAGIAQEEIPGDALPVESPLHHSEEQSLPPLWQAIETNILMPQVNLSKNPTRVNARNAVFTSGTLWFSNHLLGAYHDRTSFYLVDTPNVNILRFNTYQAYQCIDLPPPVCSACI